MKKFCWILMLMCLLLPVQAGLADEPLDSALLTAALPETEYAAERQQAIAALQARTPDAAVDYAVRERDDGRYEWHLFFTLGNQIGECEVIEEGFQIQHTTLYDLPEGGLKASEAMAALVQQKGELVIVDLELDRENGRICFEGEATLNDRRYEFEVSAQGDIIEWERD